MFGREGDTEVVEYNPCMGATVRDLYDLDVGGSIHYRAVGHKVIAGTVVNGQHGVSRLKVDLKLSLEFSARKGGGFTCICTSTSEGTG